MFPPQQVHPPVHVTLPDECPALRKYSERNQGGIRECHADLSNISRSSERGVVVAG
jgi:hypothetical protein